eukprot:11350263-Alexandrium_andersonii.AAC.1
MQMRAACMCAALILLLCVALSCTALACHAVHSAALQGPALRCGNTRPNELPGPSCPQTRGKPQSGYDPG